MDGKPPEFYIGLAAAMGFVYARLPHLTNLPRAMYAGISGGFGYAAAPDIAKYTGQSEILAVIVITGLGWVVLDQIATLLSDTPWVRKIVGAQLKVDADEKDK